MSLKIFIAGLLLAIFMENNAPVFYWLRPPPAKQVALMLKVLGTADSLDEQPGSQVLWSHFRLSPVSMQTIARSRRARWNDGFNCSTRFQNEIALS
jgi:hypothetical protein